MTKRSRSVLIVVLLILLCLIALLFARCRQEKPKVVSVPSPAAPAPAASAVASAPSAPAAATPDDVLTPATLHGPASVVAGAVFAVDWQGPNNAEDFITITPTDAPASSYGDYKPTRTGPRVELTAPVEPGPRELRYVAGRAGKILGRAPIEVLPAAATLSAPDQAVLGTTIRVTWTGPNNADDYITVVSRETPDGQYGNYTNTSKGSPLELTLPDDAGEAEIRYMTGSGRKVLGRRSLTITTPATDLTAPAEAAAGATIEVTWRGPDNPNDYVTVVPAGSPDGQYRNYTPTAKGSPLKLLLLIDAGPAELRYMTGSNGRVLARRPITLTPLAVSLDAASAASAGSTVEVKWTGPAYAGDYVTIVPASAAASVYAGYEYTTKGSPMKVPALKQPGPAEIRYVSGQGGRVLARRPILITP